MKNIVYLMTLVLIGTMFTGCSSCQSGNEKQENADSIAGIVKFTASVEDIIALDRECVWLHVSNDYKWYETTVLYEHFFDAEDTDYSLLEIVNVFQAGTTAIKCQHFDDGTEYGYAKALWVGDFDLSDENVKLTFEDAYNRMMEADIVKPHGRYCVLRREVGPKPNVAPQYIFGNSRRQVYVDAVSGDVTDKNPVFDGFEEEAGMPLGEWP